MGVEEKAAWAYDRGELVMQQATLACVRPQHKSDAAPGPFHCVRGPTLAELL